jgi:hypothetical protein
MLTLAMPDTAIPPDTIAAYLATDFWVDGEAPFVMRIGAPCEALQTLYASYGCQACAFITAFNPLGEITDDSVNDERQAAFAQTLDQRGLPYLNGAGRDPHGKYPAESSFLVLGTTLEEASAIGRELRQNAIVWCGADRIAQLILLR